MAFIILLIKSDLSSIENVRKDIKKYECNKQSQPNINSFNKNVKSAYREEWGKFGDKIDKVSALR